MKLSGSTKAIVRNIVGDLSVGTPDAEVLEVVRSKLSADAPRAFVRAVERFALKAHAANLREYRFVMGGVR